MGITFKENVSDLRNSKVVDVISELKSYSVKVDVVDPFASPKEVKHEYGIDLAEKVEGKYDAVIVAVSHDQYAELSEEYFKGISTEDGIVVDIKGIYRNKIKSLSYWSL